MSTDLKTRAAGVRLTRFFGGSSRGPCVQVDSSRWEQPVQLTRAEAAQLARDLLDFAAGDEQPDMDVFGIKEVDSSRV